MEKLYILTGVILIIIGITITALSGMEKSKHVKEPESYKTCPNPDVNLGLGSVIIILSVLIMSMGLL